MPPFRSILKTAWSRVPPLWVWYGVVTLMLLGTGLHLVSSFKQAKVARLSAELALARTKAAQSPLPPAASPDINQALKKKLPSRQRADDIVRDAGRLAQSANVAVSSVAMAPVASSTSEWGHVGITLNAACSYDACKTFVAELLGRYPSLAIRSLGLKPASAGVALQDLRLGLVLYVND